MNKTIWFYRNRSEQIRKIWAGIYSSRNVRRARWLRALVIAVETIDAVAPMIQDEETLRFIRTQLDKLGAEVSDWGES